MGCFHIKTKRHHYQLHMWFYHGTYAYMALRREYNDQKQFFANVLQNSYSQKFSKFRMKTPVLDLFLINFCTGFFLKLFLKASQIPQDFSRYQDFLDFFFYNIFLFFLELFTIEKTYFTNYNLQTKNNKTNKQANNTFYHPLYPSLWLLKTIFFSLLPRLNPTLNILILTLNIFYVNTILRS